MTTHLPPLGLGDAAGGTPGIKTLEPSRRRSNPSEGIDVVDTRPKKKRAGTRSSRKSSKAVQPSRAGTKKPRTVAKKIKATVKKLAGKK